MVEVTRSEAVGIALIDADRDALQMAAQQNLPGPLQSPMQIAELPPEFQRWLQQPNDPLNITDLENIPSLQSAFRTAGFRTYLGAQIRIGQRTEGVLSCFRFTDRGYSVDEIALVMALAELMGMLLETDRLRQSARTMAVLDERQRLARDLHDSVTQSLYSLSLFSRAGFEAAKKGDTDRLDYNLTEVERNTLHALREMRLLLYELRPANLEQEGLIRTVELRLNTVERRVGLQLDVQLDELPDMSPEPGSGVVLYHRGSAEQRGQTRCRHASDPATDPCPRVPGVADCRRRPRLRPIANQWRDGAEEHPRGQPLVASSPLPASRAAAQRWRL